MSKSAPEFTIEDVEILERRECHRRFLRIDLVTLKHRLHEGGWLGPLERELLIKDPAVGVLLFDPDRDELVLVRQFRVGVLDEKQSPWLLELVAGMVDEGETPLEVAARECREEANLTPQILEPICEYYCSPGTSNEKLSLFCGRVDSSAAGGVYGLADEHEDIEVVTLSYDEVVAALENGEIDNAMTLIAVQWLILNKAKLVARWSSD